MILLRYTCISWVDDPRDWDFFKILGEINYDGRVFNIIYNPQTVETIIREQICMNNNKYSNGNLLASIDDDVLHEQLVQVAKKEGIIR